MDDRNPARREGGGIRGGSEEEANGVRRRRASQNEEVEHVLGNGQHQSIATAPTHVTADVDEGAVGRSPGRSRQSSTASAADQPPVLPSSSLDHAGRTVRFSADVERDAVSMSAPIGGGTTPESRSRVTSAHSTTRNSNSNPVGLVLELGPTDGHPNSSVLGESITESPSQSVLLPPRISAARSPTSPRSRGYSLRRTIFSRSMDDTNADSIIELQETASSSNLHQPSGVSREASKKSSHSITISALPVPIPPFASTAKPSFKDRKGFSSLSALPNYETWVRSHYKKPVVPEKVGAFLSRVRKTVLRIQEIPPTKDGRHIDLDASRKKSLTDERTGKDYISNNIRSTRFTAWNFIPRQLFAQFSRLANFYFLCVAVLQMIPGLSTTGMYTTIVPLMFFVSISMAKEGYDDYRRFKLDKAENAMTASVLHAYQSTTESTNESEQEISTRLGPLHWATVKWKDLRVGDIVRLKRNEAAPADLILLHSNGANGIAYVETMALDGETNLKSKQTTSFLASSCATAENLAQCRAHFVVEDPNPNLYRFDGRVSLNDETAPLTNTEIIYRGSILRNTQEAVGMVIYTGEECKIRMNANKHPRIKAPHLQYIVNKVVIVIVIFVLSLAIFNTIAYQIWQTKRESKSWYLTKAKVPFVPILTSFFIMFNTMIPLSLYVSMEIIKLAQIVLLNDVDMYDEKSDTPFEARTSTINEELGQVSYVFSDKTGTLTDNEMKFRKMSVAGTAWLHDFDLKRETKSILIHKKRSKGKKPARKSSVNARRSIPEASAPGSQYETGDRPNATEEPKWKSSARPAKSQPELRTVDLIRYLQQKPNTHFAMKAKMLLLSIALCHTCIPEVQDDGSIDFQASSPDELALVRAAQELGYVLIDREHSIVTLRLTPTPDAIDDTLVENYEILDVIEFSSRRKRMSVLVRFPDQRICLISKGADSVLMRRLKLAALADRKVADIRKRAERRKSLEAQYAIARKSSLVNRKSSLNRHSLSLRRSSVGLSRRSTSGQAAAGLQPVRHEVDSWLRDRERDVELANIDDGLQPLTSPRQSAQANRRSLAVSEPRSSVQFEDVEDLVDESIVMDDATVIERCFQHINDFATEGLRTLLYGYRFVPEAEYETWKKGYFEATTSLFEREEKIEKAGEFIEYDFDLAGATAIEDKLQSGVPEAIDKLRRANIRMWMLTGDKRETAVNIGHSCRLIKDYSSVIVLDREIGEVEHHIAAAILSINSGNVAHSVVVVDGQTLTDIEENKVIEKLFFDLTILVDSVICCRASPSQKAHLVKAIRKRVKNSVTLAIGDGANDIAMIQEAHVGIGITGKEGLQAARSSDYSIAQFRFLSKLLLVHGRWNYIRTCKYVLGTFWKEMLFYLTQALYQRFNGYTGTSLYEPWSLAMFNTLFTSLPVIFMGIFEKDLSASTLLAVPELYTKGQRNGGFNFWIYLGWMFMASSEAMIVFFCMYGLFGQAIFTNDNSLFAMGDLTFSACVIIISVKILLLEMHNKSIVVAIAVLLSVGGWFFWNILLSVLYAKNKIYTVRGGFIDHFGRNPTWWLTLILIIACVVVWELGVASLRAAWWPTDVDTFQELERDLEIRKRFEEASALELQQGWNRGTKKSSFELERDTEVEEILKTRGKGVVLGDGDDIDGHYDDQHPFAMGEGADAPGRASVGVRGSSTNSARQKRWSFDIQSRFGSIKREE